jgi:putative PIN family toxin of toxin-antitoxin system
MAKTPVRAVIDTNILISAIIFGGNPKKIIELIEENKLIGVTSQTLISELLEVLVKKFHFTPNKLYLVEELIKENFTIVYPNETLDIVRDKDDNRVLEAAITGECQYIITGDADLLDLKTFQKIKIVTAEIFLKEHEAI